MPLLLQSPIRRFTLRNHDALCRTALEVGKVISPVSLSNNRTSATEKLTFTRKFLPLTDVKQNALLSRFPIAISSHIPRTIIWYAEVETEIRLNKKKQI